MNNKELKLKLNFNYPNVSENKKNITYHNFKELQNKSISFSKLKESIEMNLDNFIHLHEENTRKINDKNSLDVYKNRMNEKLRGNKMNIYPISINNNIEFKNNIKNIKIKSSSKIENKITPIKQLHCNFNFGDCKNTKINQISYNKFQSNNLNDSSNYFIKKNKYSTMLIIIFIFIIFLLLYFILNLKFKI